MYPLFRRLLFNLDPEQAHSLTLSLMRLVGAVPPLRGWLHRQFAMPQKPVQVFGLTFANPVGLAAGYDKDGLGWRGLACLGFGHIEIGTVTVHPQAGNPLPRVFRLPAEQALINRMGFPGLGAEFVARRLGASRPAGLILGVNLGKNKDTPLEEAANDYLVLIEKFAPLADYLAVNISSPNTVGLRRLQGREFLEKLLGALKQRRSSLTVCPPLLVKLAPDLSDDELDDALDVMLRLDIDGVIASNTTTSREGVQSSLAHESGGLSGAPLRQKSMYMLEQIQKRTGGRLPVIAAGGIMNVEDAQARLDAGAVLVQVYTGMIYAGPGLVRQIVRGIREY